jgi:hypothetical protein
MSVRHARDADTLAGIPLSEIGDYIDTGRLPVGGRYPVRASRWHPDTYYYPGYKGTGTISMSVEAGRWYRIQLASGNGEVNPAYPDDNRPAGSPEANYSGERRPSGRGVTTTVAVRAPYDDVWHIQIHRPTDRWGGVSDTLPTGRGGDGMCYGWITQHGVNCAWWRGRAYTRLPRRLQAVVMRVVCRYGQVTQDCR